MGSKMHLWSKWFFFFTGVHILKKVSKLYHIAPIYLSSAIFQRYKLISFHFHPIYALRPYLQILTQSPRKCPKSSWAMSWEPWSISNHFRPHGHTQRIFHLSVIFPERKWHSNLNSKVLDLLDRKVHLQWSSASCATPPPRLARFPGENFRSQKLK